MSPERSFLARFNHSMFATRQRREQTYVRFGEKEGQMRRVINILNVGIKDILT